MKQATNVLALGGREDGEPLRALQQRRRQEHQGVQQARRGQAPQSASGTTSTRSTPRAHVPYIVFVIDEMADLMMQSEEGGGAGHRAPRARRRAPWASTSSSPPSARARRHHGPDQGQPAHADRLPGRVARSTAASSSTRWAPRSSSGQGDMLYTPPQSSQLVRVQGALVEDHELQALVDHVCEKAAHRTSTSSSSRPPPARRPRAP